MKIYNLIFNCFFLIIFCSCKNENNENYNFKGNNSYDSLTNRTDEVEVGNDYIERTSDSIANESINPYFDEEKWKQDAEEYLRLNRGEKVTIKKKEKNLNRPKYYRSTDIPKDNFDFEYSEYWRKEAYRLSKEFIIDKNSKSKTKNCTVVSLGTYEPEYVKYIGEQKYIVKVMCVYECDNGRIGDTTVKIEAHYMSNNLWDIHLYK